MGYLLLVTCLIYHLVRAGFTNNLCPKLNISKTRPDPSDRHLPKSL